VLTDLSPQAADVCWYGLRAWIEQGFKRIQRGGWQWQYTRMDDPARAQRLWLAIALATWWWLSVGGEAEAALPVETLPTVPGAARRQNNGWRLVGIFRQGWRASCKTRPAGRIFSLAEAKGGTRAATSGMIRLSRPTS
jgi:hypothetical protein